MGYKNAARLNIAKRQRTVKKVLYVFYYFTTMVQLYNYLFQRAESSQKHSLKEVVLKKLKAHFERHRPKTGLEYMYLQPLHDNAPAHKACIVTEFLESEKVNVLPRPPFFT